MIKLSVDDICRTMGHGLMGALGATVTNTVTGPISPAAAAIACGTQEVAARAFKRFLDRQMGPTHPIIWYVIYIPSAYIGSASATQQGYSITSAECLLCSCVGMVALCAIGSVVMYYGREYVKTS